MEQVVLFCQRNNLANNIVIINLTSQKFGSPYTDKVEIKNNKDGLVELSVLESEAQSYVLKKTIARELLNEEIKSLENASGNFVNLGYTMYQI